MVLLLFSNLSPSSDPKQGYLNNNENVIGLLIFLLIMLGSSITIKTSIRPQVMPFLVRDEIKFESGSAYSAGIDHFFTSLSLIIVAIFQQELTYRHSIVANFTYIILLSFLSFFAYIILYYIDVYVRDGQLNSKNLMKQEDHRHRFHMKPRKEKILSKIKIPKVPS